MKIYEAVPTDEDKQLWQIVLLILPTLLEDVTRPQLSRCGALLRKLLHKLTLEPNSS